MMKYSLCIEPVLPDMEPLDRIAVAAEIGYDAVEFWNPARIDAEEAVRRAARCGIEVSACCAFQHRRDHLASDRAVPSITRSIEELGGLGIRRVILMSGDVHARVDDQRLILVENLKRLRDAAEKHGVCLLLEPLNSYVDHKGYYLDSSYVAFEIVRIVDSPNVKVLYDVYHMQIMEGNILDTIAGNLSRIGHIHLAGVPNRHEPSLGELDIRRVLRQLEALGYNGYVGMEYWPLDNTRDGLLREFQTVTGGR